MSAPTDQRIAELLARIEHVARQFYRNYAADHPVRISEDEYVRGVLGGSLETWATSDTDTPVEDAPYGVSQEAPK